MDRVDPPAGRLSVVAGPGRGPGRPTGEIWFTGWLGLLRALSEATGAPGAGPGPERLAPRVQLAAQAALLREAG
jgi:hypothetical protein